MFMNIFLFFVCMAGMFSVVESSSYGWDTQSLSNQTVVDCMKKTVDTQFIVLTAQDKDNHVDPNICSSLKMAKTNDIAIRDVKFYPCPNCAASAGDQINSMLNNLARNCDDLWSRRVWLDMNSHGVWSTPWHQAGYASNQKWFASLVDACVSHKDISCGIYSSPDEWKWTLEGSVPYSYAPATALPLWYKSPNGMANFDDFKPFGGFTTPYAKQYVSSVNICGSPNWMGQDWAPTW